MTALNPDSRLRRQAAFRALMEAMARPGEIRTLRGVTAPAPLAPATAALVQSLADYDTPVWLDRSLADTPEVAKWIQFHTGAPLVTDPGDAAFALDRRSTYACRTSDGSRSAARNIPTVRPR